jgi:transglutaminase-like putative cysteine protease
MPPPADPALVRELARAATARADALEARVRALEIADARRDGASSGWSRAQPWVSALISLAALGVSVLR